MIAGCGGGGGDGTSSGETVYLSGIAASGAAIVSAKVSVKDKNGIIKEGNTNMDGKYQIEVSGLIYPFLLKVTKDDLTLYSVATTAGIANIHPFTDLIIRNWYKVKGTDIAAVFGNSGSIPDPPTTNDIATIENVVRQILRTYLQGAGIDFAQFNLITSPFEADNAGFDLVLENLKVNYSGENIIITPKGGKEDTPIVSLPENTDLTTLITPPPLPSSDTDSPTIPTNLTATRISQNQVVLSWSASTDNYGVTGYKVYRSGVQIGIMDQLFYIDGEPPATNTCYTISAFDASGNISTLSSEVCAGITIESKDTEPPSSPILTSAPISSSQVNLSWTASTDNVAISGYRVSVDGITITTTTNTSFSHTGLTGNTTYHYTVVALDTSGNYASSDPVSVTTLSSFSLIDYYNPLKKDNQWKYRGVDQDGNSIEWLEQVTEQVTINGKPAMKIEEYGRWNCPDYNWVDNAGIWFFGWDEEGHQYLYNPPIHLPAIVTIGQAYQGTVDLLKDGVKVDTMTWSLTIEDTGSVITPAGTFEDCLKIKIDSRTQDDVDIRYEWWAKGIGEVKSEEIADTPSGELLWAIIDGKNYGDNGGSGNWDITISYNGAPFITLPTYTISQSGSNLILSYALDSTPKGTGTISNTSVSFSTSYICLNFTFNGTLDNNIINGTCTADNGYNGTFTMTKNTPGSYTQLTIPTATVNIDGNTSDWSGISPIITDNTGEGNSSVSGSDIYRVYLAKDSINLYVRLDLANGTPSDDLYIGIDVYQQIDQQAGDRLIFFNFPTSVTVESRNSACDGYHSFVAVGAMVVNGSIVEASVPLSALNASSTRFIRVHNDSSDDVNSIDWTYIAKIMF